MHAEERVAGDDGDAVFARERLRSRFIDGVAGDFCEARFATPRGAFLILGGLLMCLGAACLAGRARSAPGIFFSLGNVAGRLACGRRPTPGPSWLPDERGAARLRRETLRAAALGGVQLGVGAGVVSVQRVRRGGVDGRERRLRRNGEVLAVFKAPSRWESPRSTDSRRRDAAGRGHRQRNDAGRGRHSGAARRREDVEG